MNTKLFDNLNNDKHILIVSDIANWNRVIRAYEKQNGKPMRNVVPKTIIQVATELFYYLQSVNGFGTKIKILDMDEASLLFRNVILDNISKLNYFKDEKILDIATAGEIFSKVDWVRKNGWNGKEDIYSPRINDIKVLIDEYESELQKNDMYDATRIIRFLVDNFCETIDTKTILGGEVTLIEEDSECISKLEKNFVEKLCPSHERFFTSEPSIEDLKVIGDHAKFYRGYGPFNEVSYIVNDIAQNNIPFGKVAVYYTSESQIPALKTNLCGNGINAKFVSNCPVSDNPIINIAKLILEWANDDFSEIALEKIFAHNALFVEYTDAGVTENAIKGSKYFQYVLAAANRRDNSIKLGWGYDWNWEFLENEKKFASTADIDAIIEMHEELLNIFGDSGKAYSDSNQVVPAILFDKLLGFIKKYKFDNKENNEGLKYLKDIRNSVAMETRTMNLADAITYISEVLSCVKAQEDETSCFVTVKQLTDWNMLEREYVYIIGLSLKDLQGNTTESPVLYDVEMVNWLEGDYKPIIETVNNNREKSIVRTISTFTGDKITFGYSDYDIVSFCESNPSTLYRSLLSETSGENISDIPKFIYGNPTSGLYYSSTIGKDRTDFTVKKETSNSSIKIFLDCPKKYMFEKILYIPKNDYYKQDEKRWLNALDYGLFFHEVAEKYVGEKFIKPYGVTYDTDVDSVRLNEIIEEIKKKYLGKVPVAFSNQADEEVEKFKDMAEKFFQRQHEKFNLIDREWRVLCTEKRFEEVPYSVEDYDHNTYDFIFTGIIDRIDYKIVGNNIYIRVVDYKTRKKDNEKKDNLRGAVIQHLIYREAVSSSVLIGEIINEISKLEKGMSTCGMDIMFDSFLYLFPKELSEDDSYTVEDADIEGINLTRLKSCLTTMTRKKKYPDRLELFGEINDFISSMSVADSSLEDLQKKMASSTSKKTLSTNESKGCENCDYQDVCNGRKAGEF